MPFAVGLYFDPATEAALRSIWEQIGAEGVALDPALLSNRPHLALSVHLTWDVPEAQARLERLAARQIPFPISFEYIGLFPVPLPVVWLGPVVTQELLSLHRFAHDELDGLGRLPDYAYYQPGSWVPHCTLAMGMEVGHVLPAIEIVRRLVLPLNGQITEIGAIEFPPIKNLFESPLGGAQSAINPR